MSLDLYIPLIESLPISEQITLLEKMRRKLEVTDKDLNADQLQVQEFEKSILQKDYD